VIKPDANHAKKHKRCCNQMDEQQRLCL